MNSNWKNLISNINVWKRGDQRAPHKPLLTLLLLARAQQGLSAFVSFEEIDKKLKIALVEFGPQRKSYHPENPFWHLKTNGFWEVRDADKLELRTGGHSPSRRTLLSHNAIGEVPEELWAELDEDSALVPKLAQLLLNEFWPKTFHDDIAEFFGLEMVVGQGSVLTTSRKRDPNFRKEVLRAYDRCCAICGYNGCLGTTPFGLEAAHIKWHALGGQDIVPNGLALCSLHHKAFDRGAIGCNEKFELIVSKDLVGGDTVTRSLIDISGKPLRKPQDKDEMPDVSFIRWHLANVFQNPERTVRF